MFEIVQSPYPYRNRSTDKVKSAFESGARRQNAQVIRDILALPRLEGHTFISVSFSPAQWAEIKTLAGVDAVHIPSPVVDCAHPERIVSGGYVACAKCGAYLPD